MVYYLFRLFDAVTIADAEREFEKQGLKDLYVIEDDSTGQVLIGGTSKKRLQLEKITYAHLVEEKQEARVDWHAQWAQFAENFVDGKAQIDLSRFGKPEKLLLIPGAGFGDLSHPTTYLMLELMRDHIQGQSIIDIGTGSGILALAALLLGASSAIGIDIDEEALAHARENALLNQLASRATFSKKLPKTLPAKNILLMNMILPEQRQFDPQRLNSLAKFWITSGILTEQREEYLKQAALWNWKPVSEKSRGEWMGFIFTC